MKPFSIILGANEVREVGVSGSVFELRAAPFMVDRIELLDANHVPVGIMEDAEATDKERLPVTFHHVRITNGANAQTIRFYYGTGDAGSNRFTGVVSGQVSLDAATLAALEAIDLNAATIAAMKLPALPGASFVAGSTLAAGVPELVFTAAANVNGAVIHGADFSESSASLGRVTLLAKATAPANPEDGVIVMRPRVVQETAAKFHYGGSLSRETRIAPGLALYFITSYTGGGAADTGRSCRYTLL